MESESERSTGDTEAEGILTGTASERAPGVGGSGDHPAPAAVRDPDGSVHVAGEPVGVAPSAPVPGEPIDDPPSGATQEEARERLNRVSEPVQVETKRPDIGTE